MTVRTARRERQRRRFAFAMCASVAAHIAVFAFIEFRGPSDPPVPQREVQVLALDAPESASAPPATRAASPATGPLAAPTTVSGEPGEPAPPATIPIRAASTGPRSQLHLAPAEATVLAALPVRQTRRGLVRRSGPEPEMRNHGVLFRPTSQAARESFGGSGYDGVDVIYSGGGVDPVCKPRPRALSGVDRNAQRRPPPPPDPDSDRSQGRQRS